MTLGNVAVKHASLVNQIPSRKPHKGGDYVPLHVINNPQINIEHYLSERRKGKKEKGKKSSWNI